MTNTDMSKSLISALQNRGGYCRHTVIDNPSDRIYRALSWLFAMTSAFVHIGISYLRIAKEILTINY
jgi:hypothetical protein